MRALMKNHILTASLLAITCVYADEDLKDSSLPTPKHICKWTPCYCGSPCSVQCTSDVETYSTECCETQARWGNFLTVDFLY